jgi:MFS family permease
VLQLTSSPLAIGLVTTLQFLPIMLLSLFGGVIVDRIAKHRLIMTTQAIALVQSAIFGTLVATGAIQLWHVYLLAAIQGIINAIDNPARQAFVPEIAGRDHLVNAVALNSMLFNGARVVGPAVAGLMIARFGIAPTLFVDAASYLAVLFGLFRMDPTKFFGVTARSEGRVLQRLTEGLRYVWRTPDVLLILVIVGVIGTFGYNFSLVLPLLAGFVLHTSAEGFGGLSAFLGLGSLVAAVATAYTRQVTFRRLLIGSAAFSVFLAGVALSTNYVVSVILLALLGFAGITFTTSANTRLQLTVPDELRGRVMSLYILLFAGSTPIGGFLIGSLSNVIGVSYSLLICAALCALGVAGAALYRWRTV